MFYALNIERMFYLSSKKIQKVIYEPKDGKQEKVFDALEWPALLNFPKGTLFNRVSGHVCLCVSARRQVFSRTKHKGEQMVRYYGYYSNVCRGRRQTKDQDG